MAKSRFAAPFIGVDQLAEASNDRLYSARGDILAFLADVCIVYQTRQIQSTGTIQIQLRLAAAYGYKLLGSDITDMLHALLRQYHHPHKSGVIMSPALGLGWDTVTCTCIPTVPHTINSVATDKRRWSGKAS